MHPPYQLVGVSVDFTRLPSVGTAFADLASLGVVGYDVVSTDDSRVNDDDVARLLAPRARDAASTNQPSLPSQLVRTGNLEFSDTATDSRNRHTCYKSRAWR